MTADWLSIVYRDFYDVPRAFIVERNAELYFFDCPFSDELDDYPQAFNIYRLPEESREGLDTQSWAGLQARGEFVGTIPIKLVEFDNSKRESIRSSTFANISWRSN
ncbi:MAG TPA: hypothetical protein VGJ18_06305 [Gemmatimonadaceae bacterium]|jgi:hypothetical protein